MQSDSSSCGQTYFNMSNMNPSGSLTSLTAVQEDGFQSLMPLNPVQYSEDQHQQQQQSNGFHEFMPISQVKQEPDTLTSEDGESLEARLFQSISVKQEFYPYQAQANSDIPMYATPYFDKTNTPNETPPLDIKFVTREFEFDNGLKGMNGQEIKKEISTLENCDFDFNGMNNQENNEDSSLSEDIFQSKNVKKPKNNKKSSIKAEVECDTMSPPPVVEKTRRKFDRFNGIPLEEVQKKFLPDHLAHNLDILIVGINPGLYAAHVGHHYAGPGNHFWKCMFLSGLIPEAFTAKDDFRMLEYGIGFTNVVARTTRSSTDLSKKEMKEGSDILKLKIQEYKPRIAVFNGKTIYEIYSGSKHFFFGRQPVKVEGTDTHIWVMPSSSARCAQLPRATDKVPFYAALRKYLDYLRGQIQEPDESEIVFSAKLTNMKKVPKIEPDSASNEEESNSSTNNFDTSMEGSPVKGRPSPQKRKSEQTVKAKKK